MKNLSCRLLWKSIDYYNIFNRAERNKESEKEEKKYIERIRGWIKED